MKKFEEKNILDFFNKYIAPFYNVLPLNSLVTFDKNYIVSFRHGGLTPQKPNSKEFLADKKTKFNNIDTTKKYISFEKNKHSTYSYYIGYQYSDFTSQEIKTYDYDDYATQMAPNTKRGAGFIAGIKGTQKYLQDNGLSLIVRGHQHSGIGAKYPFKILDAKYKNVGLKSNSFFPNNNSLVFTTYSCPSLQKLNQDCFLLFTFENNKLKVDVHKKTLPENRCGKFITIDQKIIPKWQNQNPETPISKTCIDTAQNNN
jgi:hypothetical protein